MVNDAVFVLESCPINIIHRQKVAYHIRCGTQRITYCRRKQTNISVHKKSETIAVRSSNQTEKNSHRWTYRSSLCEPRFRSSPFRMNTCFSGRRGVVGPDERTQNDWETKSWNLLCSSSTAITKLWYRTDMGTIYYMAAMNLVTSAVTWAREVKKKVAIATKLSLESSSAPYPLFIALQCSTSQGLELFTTPTSKTSSFSS